MLMLALFSFFIADAPADASKILPPVSRVNIPVHLCKFTVNPQYFLRRRWICSLFANCMIRELRCNGTNEWRTTGSTAVLHVIHHGVLAGLITRSQDKIRLTIIELLCIWRTNAQLITNISESECGQQCRYDVSVDAKRCVWSLYQREDGVCVHKFIDVRYYDFCFV